ncbi:MAG: cation transporter [Candidatus Saccharibacteria bacterium]|nr:cation transporter [Candidatus Saccharibacteria bacterium]
MDGLFQTSHHRIKMHYCGQLVIYFKSMSKQYTSKDLLQCGLRLEYFTLIWNVLGIFITAVAALKARSVAVGGFGLDSLIEIGASTVVIWELKSTKEATRAKALRLIGISFYIIATYILLQVIYLLIRGTHPRASVLGIAWTAVTFITMLLLANAKRTTGNKLKNPVLITEAKVTLVDAYLAASVMTGLILNATLHFWWADLLSALVIVFYGFKEGGAALDEARHY